MVLPPQGCTFVDHNLLEEVRKKTEEMFQM